MARRALVALLLVAASLLATFVTIELCFRAREAWLEATREPWALFDEQLGYRLNPAFPGHNADGFFDHPFPPRSQRLRLLMLGDSLAYTGDDVDDTWVARLRQRLQQTPGSEDVEVLNAAVPGYTNYQELLWLELHGAALEPDLVGVGFVLNDLYHFLQQLPIENGRVVNRFEPTPEALAGDAPPLGGWIDRSRFLAWLRRRGALHAWRRADSDGFTFEQRIDLRAAWKDAPWRDVELQLRAMQVVGAREGFDLFLVVFPVAEQYDPSLLERDRDFVLSPQRRLDAICRRLALPCLDLYPLLDASRDLQDDGIHLTAQGRRHVAELVAGFVLERGLLRRRVKPSAGGAEAPSGAYVPPGAQGASR